MGLRVNTNIASINAQRSLGQTTERLQANFRRLSTGLRISTAADDAAGRAHWEAWYTFSASGRKVHNIIDATFEFRDGKIVKHTDRFDLHRWAGLALGLPGTLLGWTPFLQNKIRAMAQKGLADYQRNNSPTEPSQRS